MDYSARIPERVWLAGQTIVTDLKGHDIAGNFDEQARTIFALMNRTLERRRLARRPGDHDRLHQ